LYEVNKSKCIWNRHQEKKYNTLHHLHPLEHDPTLIYTKRISIHSVRCSKRKLMRFSNNTCITKITFVWYTILCNVLKFAEKNFVVIVAKSNIPNLNIEFSINNNEVWLAKDKLKEYNEGKTYRPSQIVPWRRIWLIV